MVETAPLWSVLVLMPAAGAFALFAAALDALLAAAAYGRPVAPAGAAPLREVARLLVTTRRTTPAPDAPLWRLGSAGVTVAALLASVVTPVGGYAVADLDIGVVWWTALMALLWVLVWLAGWGPNSAYSLVAGYRFIAQALAYEMPLALSVITAALAAGSLRLGAIVTAQQGLWYAAWMPVAFVVYLVCALAISFWGPFGQPVAADLAGGVRAELSGVDRLVFGAGRYVVLAAVAAFAVPLFLGGGLGPLLPAWLWSLLKMLAVLAALVLARWRLPLVRTDRFEELAWMVLIPAVLVQMFVVAVVVLVR